jgi:opacity protein-like surface antigen
MIRCWFAVLFAAVCLCVTPPRAFAIDGRVGLHVVRIEPNDSDAKDFSDAAWGGNLEAILVSPGMGNAFAFPMGIDYIQLESTTTEFIDRTTGLRVEQQTRQDYVRIYAGGRVGHQGHGFFRPYVGANLTLNIFTRSTDVVIPDDSDREDEIRQNLKSNTELAAGFDASLGIELNFNNTWYLDAGAKYLESFNVPAQLGDDARRIYPSYIEGYLGAGVFFGVFGG